MLGQEKTIQSRNPILWYLVPIANRMMNPRGLLKGEGVTTCFASHLNCLKEEAVVNRIVIPTGKQILNPCRNGGSVSY